MFNFLQFWCSTGWPTGEKRIDLPKSDCRNECWDSMSTPQKPSTKSPTKQNLDSCRTNNGSLSVLSWAELASYSGVFSAGSRFSSKQTKNHLRRKTRKLHLSTSMSGVTFHLLMNLVFVFFYPSIVVTSVNCKLKKLKFFSGPFLTSL